MPNHVLTNIFLSVLSKMCSAVVLFFLFVFIFVALKRYLNVFFQENRSGIKIKDNKAAAEAATERALTTQLGLRPSLNMTRSVDLRVRARERNRMSSFLCNNPSKYWQVQLWLRTGEQEQEQRQTQKQSSVGQIQLVKLQRHCSA